MDLTGRRRSRGFLVVGILLAAFNLRPALAGVSPLLGDIVRDLGLTPTTAGLITTAAVLCLGIGAPAAPSLVRRWGLEWTLLLSLSVLTFGLLMRSAGGVLPLYLGAAVSGCAIALMNVVMPGLVKQHFPDRVGVLTAGYVTALVVGAAAAAGLTVPAQRLFGGGWQVAAALGAGLSALAALAWLPQVGRRSGSQQPRRDLSLLLRDRVAWSVTLFMGLQSLTFYITLAWLPTMFRDAGVAPTHAGYLLALSNLAQVVTTLVVPVVAGRARAQSAYVGGAVVLTFAGYAGVLLAPATVSWLWAVLLGLGQGGSIALALLIITLRSPDPATATSLSAGAQSVGYVLAAAGPALVGAFRQLSGGWSVPLILTMTLLVFQWGIGFRAGRCRLVASTQPGAASVQ
jgi:CP family cyanate transporter-like MFS transporter